MTGTGKEVNVDLRGLAYAFDDFSGRTSYYLDLESGQVITVTDEVRQAWEHIAQDTYASGIEAPDMFSDVLAEYDLPEWQKDLLLAEVQVEAGYGSLYIVVPRPDPGQALQDARDFVAGVQDESLRDRLSSLLDEGGAYVRLEGVLLDRPEERARWVAFKDDRILERVRRWLVSQDIRLAGSPDRE